MLKKTRWNAPHLLAQTKAHRHTASLLNSTQSRLVGRADENGMLLHAALAPWNRGKAQVYRKTKVKVVWSENREEWGRVRGEDDTREKESSVTLRRQRNVGESWLLLSGLSLYLSFNKQLLLGSFWVGILKSIVLRWNTVTSLCFFSSLLSCNGIHSCGLEN